MRSRAPFPIGWTDLDASLRTGESTLLNKDGPVYLCVLSNGIGGATAGFLYPLYNPQVQNLQNLFRSRFSHADGCPTVTKRLSDGYPTVMNNLTRPPRTSSTKFARCIKSAKFIQISLFTSWPLPDAYPTVTRPLPDGYEPSNTTTEILNSKFYNFHKFIQISLFTSWPLPDGYESPSPTTETINSKFYKFS
jgi:hypothetical protein